MNTPKIEVCHSEEQEGIENDRDGDEHDFCQVKIVADQECGANRRVAQEGHQVVQEQDLLGPWPTLFNC